MSNPARYDDNAPPLFSHLLSSRPPRQGREGAAATGISIAFHAAILTALVLATLTVRTVAPRVTPDTIIAILQPTTMPHVRSSAPPPAAAAPDPRVLSAPALSMPVPDVVPTDIHLPTIQDLLGEARATVDPGDAGTRSGSGSTSGASTDEGAGAEHVFTPFTVAPELRNRAEVGRALQHSYPVLLRDAGIGGEVLVWLLIDTSGNVMRADVKQSSGHTALDDAALKVALTMKFTPARNRDQAVQVWVAVPVSFTAR
jgi:protein TonB